MAAAEQSVSHALDVLADTAPDKEHRAAIAQALATVESSARSQGLSSQHMARALAVATSGIQQMAGSRRLLKAMIPRGNVPQELAVAVVSKFNTSIPRTLQWLLLVYDLLESKDQLHNLYGVLFFWIDYEVLRPNLCHLLYLLTRRQDVQPFRVRRLMKLQQLVGAEPDLVALLSCYKLLCPSMVTLVVKSSRKAWFPPLDRKWRAEIAYVQEQRNRRGSLTTFGASLDASVVVDRDAAANVAIPLVKDQVTFAPRGLPQHLSAASQKRAGPSLAAIDSMSYTEIAENLEKMEMPAQLAAILRSRRLQHIVSCMPDATALRRLNHWILCRLSNDDNLYAALPAPNTEALLKALATFATFLEETPEVVNTVLQPFLRRWNGQTYRASVLRLISLLPPRPYEVLYRTILKPLNQLMLSSDADCQAEILLCYTRIAKNYASRDWNAYYEAGGEMENTFIMGDPLIKADYIRTLRELVSYVDASCGLCLQLRPSNVRIMDATLCFFEMANSLCQGYHLPLVAVPSPSVVYSCLLNGSAMNFSRMCGVLTRARDEYKTWPTQAEEFQKNSDILAPKSVENIETFNCYVMDVVNPLWRTRTLAVQNDEQTCLFDEPAVVRSKLSEAAAAKGASPEETQQQLVDLRRSFAARLKACILPDLCSEAEMPDRLMMGHHWCFVGYSRSFLEQRQASGEGIGMFPAVVKADKKAFAEYLASECGLTGLTSFLQSFITSLLPQAARE